MGGDEARLSGSVRVATTSEAANYFLLKHLPAFHGRHPHIELHVLVGNPLANLSMGEADISLRFAKADRGVPLSKGEARDGVVSRQLGLVSIDLIASTDYLKRRGQPDATGSLRGHDLLLQPGVHYLPGMDYLAQFESEARVVFRCDSLEALMLGASNGMGITAAPVFFINPLPNLVSIRAGIDERIAWLLMAKDLRRVARVRAVRDFIVELFVRWGGLWAGDDTAIP